MQNETQYVQQDSIDLRELFAILKRRKKLIWTVTGSLTVLAIIYTFFIAKPVYQTSVIVELAQINKKPVDNTNNIKQKLETVFEVNVKNKKTEFPILKSIEIPKKTSNILGLQTQGYDNASSKQKLQSILEYITNLQQKELEEYTSMQKKKLALIQDNIKKESHLLLQAEEDIANYQKKLLTISTQDAALAGIYSIEIGKKQNQIKNLNDQIFNLKNTENNIKDTLSPINIKNAKIIGQIDESEHPVKPKKKLIVIVAFITGLMLSVFLAFFLEFLQGMKKEDA